MLIGGVIDEIDRFPIYELDDQGGGSIARNLLALKSNLVGCRLVFDDLASTVEGRTATLDERDILMEFLGERLEFARKIVNGEKIARPTWIVPG